MSNKLYASLLITHLFCHCIINSGLAATAPADLETTDLEPVVLETWVNQYKFGEQFFSYGADETIYITPQTMLDLKMKESFVAKWKDQENIPLSELEPDIKSKLDMMTLRLNLTVNPKILKPQIIAVQPRHAKSPKEFITPAPYSSFLNYRLDNTFTATNKTFAMPLELGFKAHQTLFLTNLYYNQKHILQRSATSLIWDRVDSRQRLIFGDFYPATNVASGTQIIGGVSWRKYFNLAPNMSRYPKLQIRHPLPLPASIGVGLNDSEQIDTWALWPGEVIFTDLIPATGQGIVKLNVKNSLGQQQTYIYPYLITTKLLETGLHDFEYSLGWQRIAPDKQAFLYRHILFSGQHRYGISDYITLGAEFELTQNNYYMSPDIVWILGGRVQNQFSLHYLQRPEHANYGTQFTSQLHYNRFDIAFMYQNYSRFYFASDNETLNTALQDSKTLNISFNLGSQWGSLFLGYNKSQFWDIPAQQTYAFNYQCQIGQNWHLLLSYQKPIGSDTYTAFLTINYHLDNNWHLTTSSNLQPDRQRHKLTLSKQPKRSESDGYRIVMEQDSINSWRSAGRWQSHWRYGSLDTAIQKSAKQDDGRLSWSGAVAWIPGHGVHFSRPIYDSFALVVTEQPDIPINIGSEQLGVTNTSGYVVIPEISSFYENRLQIPVKTLPLNMTVDNATHYIMPSYRSGTLVPFSLHRISAVDGYLYRRNGSKEQAIEQQPLQLQVGAKTLEGIIGKEGYFYFENLPVGTHHGKLPFAACKFTLKIPESTEIMQSLGKIYCEDL